MSKIKCAVCQIKPEYDIQSNLMVTKNMVKEASKNGADLIVLPEMFICPYEKEEFIKNAQCTPGGEAVNLLTTLALKESVTIVGGSIPERDGGHLYNSSYILGPSGEVLGRHRKLHMFDVNLESGLSFYESETITPGNSITVIDTPQAILGVAICYDLRFPELFRAMGLKGVQIMVIPAVFNTTTGPAHWELLLRARAVDNQVFMIGASTAQNSKSSYLSYGNSMIIGPWGEIKARAQMDEAIIYAEISLDSVKKVRAEMPLLKHRRTDIY